MTTKAELLQAFERELRQYEWTENAARFAVFMDRARRTFDGDRLIDITGPAFQRAALSVGLKKRISYNELHALPD